MNLKTFAAGVGTGIVLTGLTSFLIAGKNKGAKKEMEEVAKDLQQAADAAGDATDDTDKNQK